VTPSLNPSPEKTKPVMVPYTLISALRWLKYTDYEFEVSLDYTVRPCLRKKTTTTNNSVEQ
jgi:hypothetical protein